MRTDLKSSRLDLMLYCVLLPSAISVVAYYVFASNYTGGVFHLSGFLEQYESGVYQFRVLGRMLLVAVYEGLLRFVSDTPHAMPLDEGATRLFYLSYFLLNTLFFVSNCALLYLFVARRIVAGNAAYFFFLVVSLMSFSVPTPYDQLSIFLFLLSIIVAETEWGVAALLLFGLCGVLGTLARETHLLVSSALAVMAYVGDSALRRRRLLFAGINVAVFSVVYIGIRLYLQSSVVAQAWVAPNLRQVTGGAILATLFVAAVRVSSFGNGMPAGTRPWRPALLLLVLSAPYLVAVALTGYWLEVRLILPLVVSLFCIQYALEDAQGHGAPEPGREGVRRGAMEAAENRRM